MWHGGIGGGDDIEDDIGDNAGDKDDNGIDDDLMSGSGFCIE